MLFNFDHHSSIHHLESNDGPQWELHLGVTFHFFQ